MLWRYSVSKPGLLLIAGLGVTVRQFLELRQVAVETGAGQRRRCVRQEDRLTAAFRGHRLADAVDNVGIDIGQVADDQRRWVVERQSAALARQELQSAVPTEVDDRVGPPLVLEPEIEGKVLVGGPGEGVMVGGCLPFDRGAGGLRPQNDVSQLERREDEVLLAVPGHGHHVAGRLPPLPADLAFGFRRQAVVARQVLFQGPEHRSFLDQTVDLAGCPPADVAADGLHCLGNRLPIEFALDPIAAVAEIFQDLFEARGHVQIAGPDVLLSAAVVVEQDRHAAVRRLARRNRAQAIAPDLPLVVLVDDHGAEIPLFGLRVVHRLSGGDHGGLDQARQLRRDDPRQQRRPGHALPALAPLVARDVENDAV